VPFTFSHPAAALPLRRLLGRFGCLSALAIGSTAPDLGFIVPVGLSRAQTHSVAGLLLFCVPAGLLAYLAFHHLFKTPLLRLFSARLQEQLAVPAARPRAPWSAVLVSLLCGAVTHICWDAFTHPGTPVVNAIGLLRLPLGSFASDQVQVFNVLQQASSIAGLLLLAHWWRSWQRRALRVAAPGPLLPERARQAAVAAIVSLPLLYALGLTVHARALPADAADLRISFAIFIFSALPAGALSVCAWCLGYRVWARLSGSRAQ
jgi:hypothetical protein